MFAKKEKPRRQNRPASDLAQFGIFHVPEKLEDLGNDAMDDDDEDLEAELAALTGETTRKSKPNALRKPIPDAELNAMVAESMKSLDVDEDVSDGEDDPDLLSELKMITGDDSPEQEAAEEDNLANEQQEANTNSTDSIVKLLLERLAMYQTAEKKAKERNESGRARRFNRGIKSLQELLHNAQAGAAVNEADIPPELPPSAISDSTGNPEAVDPSSGTGEAQPPVEPMATDTPVETVEDNSTVETKAANEETLQLLKTRQQEYKIAALSWKKAGNMQEALMHLNIVKRFDKVIAAVNAGEAVDLSDMPPSPPLPNSTAAPAETTPEKEESEVQQNSSAETPSVAETQHAGLEDIGAALKERLEIYRRTKTAAEGEGNSSKARRYGRICKQFEDAIKLHARGKPVPLDELPTPPGFPPLAPPSNPPAANVAKADPVQPTPQTRKSEPSDNDATGTTSPSRPKPPTPPARTQTAGKKPNQKITSRAEKQLLILQKRQRELKQAALSAKKDGDLDLARDYLRQAKGIQPLIEASLSGLPVDLNSIPLSPLAKMELEAHGLSPEADDNFTLISTEECVEEITGTDEQIYENLESQLIKQIKWCLSTRDHSKALGDVPGYNRWERLALGYTRDLDMLRVRKRDALPPPLHHYETKTYAIVQCCTDLNDCDIEISIIRGINYTKEADTYVMFEFPYPTDNPTSDRTSTIKGTNNPEYEAVFPLPIIERSSRQCQRAFKRHALKCQVWARGGFFRSDSLLGTVTVKLQPLETQCILHDSYPLMDGRKHVGGKLELKIRLRNPILTKQIEQTTDKWLTIDQ